MKNECLDNAGNVFTNKRGPTPVEHAKEDALYGGIGRLRMEPGWIVPTDALALISQCVLTVDPVPFPHNQGKMHPARAPVFRAR